MSEPQDPSAGRVHESNSEDVPPGQSAPSEHSEAPTRSTSQSAGPDSESTQPSAGGPGESTIESTPDTGATHDESAEEGDDGAEAWFDETWTKVHPLSPLVRGWLTIVAIPVAIFGYNWQMWQDLWRSWRSGELAENLQQNPLPYMIGGGVVLLLAVLIFVGFTLSWWFTRYKITDEHVMVKSGIFIRQHRKARIDRVQAVDLRQPLLARFTRLAELKFEVAEGDGTAATLAFLKRSEAEQLRVDIMDRAAGRTPSSSGTQPGAPPTDDVAHDPTGHSLGTDSTDDADISAGPGVADQASSARVSQLDDAPESDLIGQGGISPDQTGPDLTSPHQTTSGRAASGEAVPDRQIARVPVGRLIGSVVAGIGTIVLLTIGLGLVFVFAIIALIFVVFAGDDPREAFGVINPGLFVPALIAGAISYFNQFSSGFRFTATMTESGLRLRYGLLETTSQTVPPGRVQAIQLQQPMMWRPFGWYKVVVTVAGYGMTDRTTLLPVGRYEDVLRITAEMFPDLQIANPEEMFAEGLSGQGSGRGFTEVPARARIFDPIVRRRRGFFVTPAALMIRDGRITRKLTMVPHERIQSTALEQGPWARKKRVATLNIHIPSGPITVMAMNQDIEQITGLFETEAAHAAVARRLTDRDQWMAADELREFEKMLDKARQA